MESQERKLEFCSTQKPSPKPNDGAGHNLEGAASLHQSFAIQNTSVLRVWVLCDIDLSVCCTLLRPVGGGVTVPAGLLLCWPALCVVAHLRLSSPASITSMLPCQSLPNRLHRPDAKTPPKHKSSFKVQGTLQSPRHIAAGSPADNTLG